MQVVRFHRFGGGEVLVQESVEDPTPEADEVLVGIEAASVTPGDWKLREGLLTREFPVSLPCIPGRDGAGTVLACGSSVTGWLIGTPVMFVANRLRQGSYAERIACPVDDIVALPDTLSFAEGAALMHAGTCAWIAMCETMKMQAGQSLLVHGAAGAIGSLAVQLAHHMGLRVDATCSARHVDSVRQFGAREVFAYDEEQFPSAGPVYDGVLDLVGGTVHERSYALLKRGGVLGFLKAEPFVDRSRSYGVRILSIEIQDHPVALQAVAELARQGVWRPVVRDLLPLSQAAVAQSRLQHGDGGRGRLVLDIHGMAAKRTPGN